MGKAQNSASNIITSYQLSKLKSKALRAGFWFKALPRIDRVLVELTIQVVKNIHSSLLAKSIYEVVDKLERLLEGKFSRLTRTIGKSLAEKASLYAQKWGNYSAKSWLADESFALYIAVMHTNS